MVIGFNTQPPEGGWVGTIYQSEKLRKFQHTAARRRLGTNTFDYNIFYSEFQHTAARRRLAILPFSAQARILGFQHTAARRRLEPTTTGTNTPR